LINKGYVQIYTGDGKGKTTAALGQGLRAVGRGLKVVMIQFLKGMPTGEVFSVKRLGPDFTILRFEESTKFIWQMNEEEKKKTRDSIQRGITAAMSFMKNRECDLLILDEIMGTIHGGFVEVSQVIDLISMKPDNIELILTGRNVPEPIMEKADLVTEMKQIRHYYEKGVPARIGIES